MAKSTITSKQEDFSKWYLDVVREADLAENSEVRGCGIIKPYGFKIWKLLKSTLSQMIEDSGVRDVYFPIFIPIENVEAEKEHVEGFSPEMAVVTHGGGKELNQKLAVRPTSETSMYKAYARWIESYRDLPLRLNQWNNVVRWEMRPRPFLRWSEFLWQEGHTAFANKEEAIKEMWQMLNIYEKLYNQMAIPVKKGKKSRLERFPGAEITSTVEVMAGDGKAIQGATSHHLGQNFAKPFAVKYLGEDGEEHYVYQNSWGLSWRSIGAIIMVHGDGDGLRLPSIVSPYQIVIVPIWKDEEEKRRVISYCDDIKKSLTSYRVHIDMEEESSPGYKFNRWELKGVPLRLEIGSQEVDRSMVTLFRRDNMSRSKIPRNDLLESIKKNIEEYDANLMQQASDFQKSHIYRIKSWDEIDDRPGFFEASWSETRESEELLKEKYSMVSRVLPKENEEKKPKNKKCFITGEPAKHDWLFAKSY
jgi:prolyl-tRNA synthetase